MCTVNNKQNVAVNLDAAAGFAEVKGERFANKKQWLSPCYCVLFGPRHLAAARLRNNWLVVLRTLG